MKNKKVEMRVLVNGNPVKVHVHPKNGLHYVEARHGTEYSIEVKNNTGRKILAVLSVDGLSVINGQTATPNSPGYIVRAFSSVKIKGFRHTEESVGAFKFVEKSSSYALEKTGSEKNCGVISAIFYEDFVSSNKFDNDSYIPYRPYVPYVPYNPYSPYNPYPVITHTADKPQTFIMVSSASTSSSVANSANSALSVNCCFDSGTDWGSRIEDKIRTEEFTRGPVIGESNLYYASKESLREMGVEFEPVQAIEALPEGFVRFAAPPKNWQ